MSYFICKARYNKVMENGAEKKVTEAYLVEAVTASDAESIITAQLKPCFNDIAVKSIATKDYAEISNVDKELWFEAKVRMITIDERSGKEKKSTFKWLINADNFTEAHQHVQSLLKESVSDIEIISISETNIIEVL